MLGYFYGDIVGLEGASVLRSDQPGRRRVSNGDEFNKAAPALPHQPLLRQQPGRMVPAPPTSLQRLRPVAVRLPNLARAILARAPRRALRRLSQAAAADEK